MTDKYRQEMKTCIEKLLKEKPEDEALKTAVERVFGKALDESRLVGESIESVAYDMMEGVDEGLAEEEQKETYLHHASELMIDAIHHKAVDQLCRDKKNILRAKAQLHETLEKEKERLQNAMEAFHHYAQDKHRMNLLKDLHKTEQKTVVLIHNLTEKFRYNKPIT